MTSVCVESGFEIIGSRDFDGALACIPFAELGFPPARSLCERLCFRELLSTSSNKAGVTARYHAEGEVGSSSPGRDHSGRCRFESDVRRPLESAIPYPRLDASVATTSPNKGRRVDVCIGFGGLRGERFVIERLACAFSVIAGLLSSLATPESVLFEY